MLKADTQIKRCKWVENNELMQKYHDEEWGVPLHDDRKIFEFMLDGCKANVGNRE